MIKLTTYVKGQFIGESLWLIDDILYHSEHENLSGILFATDMAQVSDSNCWLTYLISAFGDL